MFTALDTLGEEKHKFKFETVDKEKAVQNAEEYRDKDEANKATTLATQILKKMMHDPEIIFLLDRHLRKRTCQDSEDSSGYCRAEIRREVIRASTCLREAAVMEFDTIAYLGSQAIDSYNETV